MGLAALFPSSYSQAALFGAGAAGTFITLIRVFTKLAIPDTTSFVGGGPPFISPLLPSFLSCVLTVCSPLLCADLVFSSSVYFGLSAFIVLCCVVCYLLLLRLDYAQHHMRREVRCSPPPSSPLACHPWPF